MGRLKQRENWKMHPEFTNYEVSNWGKVRRRIPGKRTYIGRILKPIPDKKDICLSE